MPIEPLTPTCGELIIRDEAWPTLLAVPDEVVHARFRARGVLVLRGFAATPADLDAFARRFSRALMPGVGRSVFPEFPLIHLVNESFDALEAHTDNGTRPEAYRPDITWMLCERPPDADGETTVFDGIEIWNRLSEGTRATLRAQRVCFASRYPLAAWRSMGFATIDAFRAFASSVGATLKETSGDGAVELEVRCSAHRRTTYGEHDAFVSSMALAGAKGFEQLAIHFEDGSPVTEEMLAEIRAAISRTCEAITWCAGDVALLDNTRILHGRRPYRDPNRRLYLLQTHKASF